MKTLYTYGSNRHPVHEKTRAACRGIVVEDGKILLSYETVSDQWLIPGGGMESGETPEACVIRELGEETGCVVRPLEQFLSLFEYYEEWEYISHYFVCEVTGRTELKLTQAEAERCLLPRWLPLEEALTIFAAHESHAHNEEKRGCCLREYRALMAYLEETKTSQILQECPPVANDSGV